MLAQRSGMATRHIGLLMVELGGGRRQASDTIDARVGLTGCAQLGQWVQAGEPLAMVHAGDAAAAERAANALLSLIGLSDEAPLLSPVLLQRLSG